MGCIFLEMLTIICDESLDYLQTKTSPDTDTRYHAKLQWILDDWLPALSLPSELGDLPATAEQDFLALKDTITRMLEWNPHHRPKADELSFGLSFQRECCPPPLPTISEPPVSRRSSSRPRSPRRASMQSFEIREGSPYRRQTARLYREITPEVRFQASTMTEPNLASPQEPSPAEEAADLLRPIHPLSLHTERSHSTLSLSSLGDSVPSPSGQSTPRTSEFPPSLPLSLSPENRQLPSSSADPHVDLDSVIQDLCRPKDFMFQLSNTDADAEPWSSFSTDCPPEERRGSLPSGPEISVTAAD
jgi:hypothetical protein